MATGLQQVDITEAARRKTPVQRQKLEAHFCFHLSTVVKWADTSEMCVTRRLTGAYQTISESAK